MDPALKFVVDVQNSEKVQQLTAEINKQTSAISGLNAQLQQGRITQQQFEAAAVQAANAARQAAQQIKEIEGASAMSARGLLQLGYAVDDIQYGFSAIVNNIPQIVMGMGGSAGIAGAVGIATVAISQLINHWSELTSKLQENWSGGSADQMQVLAERAEKAAAGFEKLLEARTKWETKAGSGLEEAFVEAGPEAFQKQLTDAMFTVGQAAEKQDIQEITSPTAKWLKEKAVGHKIPQNVQEQNQLQYEDTAKQAKQLMLDTQLPGQAGENARLRLQSIATRNPGAFSPEMRQAIDSNDPEKLKAAHEKEQEDKLIAEAHQELKRQQAAKDKAAKDEADMINDAKAEVKRQNAVKARQAADWDKATKVQTQLEDAETKKEFDDKKRERLQGLQDQRIAIMGEMKDRNEAVQKAKDRFHGGTQILTGAKAVVDMYQKAAGDAPMTQILKEQKELQIIANKKLEIIAAETLKQQRLRLPD